VHGRNINHLGATRGCFARICYQNATARRDRHSSGLLTCLRELLGHGVRLSIQGERSRVMTCQRLRNLDVPAALDQTVRCRFVRRFSFVALGA